MTPTPTPDLDRTLSALASAGGCLLALSEVPGVLGLGAAAAAGGVALLLDSGLVELWPDHPGGPALVLSSLAAYRLGVELEAPGEGTSGRWVPAGTTRAERVPKSRTRTATEADAFAADSTGLDGFADPRAVE